ncbi:tRNA glutamyl-Q(34) synthetase GluQRS [Aeoliella mucimassa]|uniref:Glutamate--tRNA ligase n=1 Tax=Aeoliella mucimassa TaxID=2527972 RepID=A0A518ATQ5_9BACT|nr:tRNA glutamyl-Q(34) synthetase GluQRS [Aeoliella mucimassa]QDU58102.1 Glutamate--tRNA ligase [Aeoliella mucimassa]
MTHRTRLAPSPTGALHLGNARTFLVNWAMARQQGWEILLRIEDLDGPRVKQGAAEEAIDLMAWLGIDWDHGPLYQSHDLAVYQQALQQLADKRAAFACDCTRSEIEAASRSAPHADEHELRYPGTCRDSEVPPAEQMFERGWRLEVDDRLLSFTDHFAGQYEVNLHQTVGDFQIWTKTGLPSYQLAVVVDDHRQQIDRIVRGNDLLSSTPRQQWLADRLDLQFAPQYWHLPLVRGSDGRRLAKRHGDTRVSHYREQGVPPERVLGLLGEWCGLGPRRPMTKAEFLAEFRIENLPADDTVFEPADDRWLTKAN